MYRLSRLPTPAHWDMYWTVKYVIIRITLKKHTTQSVFDVTKLTSLPKVGIVYSYSNIEADMMTPLLNNGYKGIIHAGVGNGNIHKNIFPSLIDARRKGIVVVRSSRVPTGPTTLDAEVDDAKYQFVASQELNPQKSRVLLMLALTKTTDWNKFRNTLTNTKTDLTYEKINVYATSLRVAYRQCMPKSSPQTLLFRGTDRRKKEKRISSTYIWICKEVLTLISRMDFRKVTSICTNSASKRKEISTTGFLTVTASVSTARTTETIW